MASSPVDVCNIALKRLGANPIVDFTDGSQEASLCSSLYQTTVDRALREHEWNFAQIRVELARRDTTPSFGFNYEYTLPTKPLCLKINETDPNDAEYDIENTIDSAGEIKGKVLRTDESTLRVRYTARIEDVSLWDASFTDYIALSLAVQMVTPLNENSALLRLLGQEAANALQHARSVDSQEGSTKQASISLLVDVRRHGWREAFSRNNNVI